jgi:hypothetical protein
MYDRRGATDRGEERERNDEREERNRNDEREREERKRKDEREERKRKDEREEMLRRIYRTIDQSETMERNRPIRDNGTESTNQRQWNGIDQ